MHNFFVNHSINKVTDEDNICASDKSVSQILVLKFVPNNDLVYGCNIDNKIKSLMLMCGILD